MHPYIYRLAFIVVAIAESMLRIDVDDLSPELSVKGPRRSLSLPFSPLTAIDGFSRKSFSYSKLPEGSLKLSIVKLDGSSFDVEVLKTATIGELKLAVEALFGHMPKSGPGKISWPHVWGHFCFCYHGQKLVTDTDHISNYGVKDGDQLHFIRHVSSNYILRKIQSKKGLFASKQKKLSPTRSCEENEQMDEDDDDCVDIENGIFQYYRDNKGEIVANREIIAHLECNFAGVRGFSYSKLPSGRRTKGKELTSTSRNGCGFFCSLKEIIELYACQCYSGRATWRED